MDYQSTIRIESKACPGVAFTLHKPSYGRVLEFDRKNAAYRDEARKINKQSRELQEEREGHRKAWFEGQAAKLAEVANGPRAVIEDGLEYERLVELAQHAMTDEQRKEVAEKLVALDAKEKEVFRIDPELLDMMRTLRERSDNLVATEYNLPRLRWGLSAIEGLTINGQLATADTLVDDGPLELVREIVTKIDEIAGMTAEELRNFEQPSSSAEAAGKAETTTIAISA